LRILGSCMAHIQYSALTDLRLQDMALLCAPQTYCEKASRNWRPGLPDPQKPALHQRPDIAVADRPGNEGTRVINDTQTGTPNIP